MTIKHRDDKSLPLTDHSVEPNTVDSANGFHQSGLGPLIRDLPDYLPPVGWELDLMATLQDPDSVRMPNQNGPCSAIDTKIVSFDNRRSRKPTRTTIAVAISAVAAAVAILELGFISTLSEYRTTTEQGHTIAPELDRICLPDSQVMLSPCGNTTAEREDRQPSHTAPEPVKSKHLRHNQSTSGVGAARSPSGAQVAAGSSTVPSRRADSSTTGNSEPQPGAPAPPGGPASSSGDIPAAQLSLQGTQPDVVPGSDVPAALSPRVIHAVVASHASELSRCDHFEAFRGEITIAFAIDSGGRVTSLQTSTSVPQAVCILKLVHTWQFPEQGPTGARGSYTFVFQ